MAMSANLHISDIENVDYRVNKGGSGDSEVLSIEAHTPTGFEEVTVFCSLNQLGSIRDAIEKYLKEMRAIQCNACKKYFPADQEGSSIVGGYRFCSSECENSYDHVLND